MFQIVGSRHIYGSRAYPVHTTDDIYGGYVNACAKR